MSTNTQNPKIALIYDRVNKWGGAERVLLAIHKLYPHSPLYTLVHEPKNSSWATGIKVIPSFFNSIPLLRSRHELLALVAPLAFETFNLDSFDIVISITSEAAKSVITKPKTLHICYCLTPTRYLWSGHKEYKKYPGLGIFSPLATATLHKFKKRLQKKDFILSHRPDKYISISKTVQNRVAKYYQQESDIIYPGINYDFWSKVTPSPSKDYYLLVSRLVPYKRVGLTIKAFSRLKQKLIVVGTGSQLPKLRSIASPNITFAGMVDENTLRSLYANAKALIFPQKEDFGLTSLEAQAAGVPVIAYKYGGAQETVINNKTGIFFTRQNSQSLISAIDRFETNNHQITPKNCQENAKRFSEDLFLEQFSAKVSSLWRTKHSRQ